jgi:peptide/nickel transport system substrate-binding protein
MATNDRDASLSREEFLKRAAVTGVALTGIGASAGIARAEQGGHAVAAIRAKTATFDVRSRDDFGSADPAFSATGLDNQAQQCVFEGLLTFVPDTSQTAKRLVDRWEPSKNGLQYRFRLRQGVMFHHGYGELTADDVKFSFERIAGLIKPNLNSPYHDDWGELQAVKVHGKYDGTIILKKPYAPLLNTTIPYIAGMVVSRKAVTQLGKAFAHKPIGTGPYEFTSWSPKQKLVLSRFAEWQGAPKPAWDEIVFHIISEEQTALIGLQTGELDAAPVDTTSAKSFANKSGFKVVNRSTLNYAWIGMNQLDPKLRDINVRQAIRYAIDVPSIIEAAFEGQVKRATSVLAPGMPVGYWKGAPVYNRNVAKAKEFLKKAANPPTSLTFTTYLSQEGAKTTAEVAQANLKDIGIDVSIITKDQIAPGKFLRDQQLFYLTYNGIAPDPVFATRWFRCNEFDQWNWMYWCNKQFDALDNAAVTTVDRARRNRMYIEEQKLWDRAANSVWVAWLGSPTIAKSNLKVPYFPWGDPGWTAVRAV